MVFTLVLLILEFTIGIWSVVLWDEVSVEAIDIMTNSFEELKKGFDKKNWAKLQMEVGKYEHLQFL